MEKLFYKTGIIAGFLGGLSLLLVLQINFGLGFLHGYLYLLVILFAMVFAVEYIKKNTNQEMYYGIRFLLSFFTYLILIATYIIGGQIIGQFSSGRLLEDLLLKIFALIGIGTVLSLISGLFTCSCQRFIDKILS